MSIGGTLAPWAAATRLPSTTAADICQQIVMTPAPVAAMAPGLDPAWWRRSTADFTARLVTTTRPVPWAA